MATPEDVPLPNQFELLQSTPSFEIVEVDDNPELKQLADDMTTGEYHDRFSPRSDPEEVRRLICEDPYGMPHRSIRLLAFAVVQRTGKKLAAGTMRIGFGQTEEEYPLETPALLKPQGGWRRMMAGDPDEVPLEESIELSRIVVARWQRPHNTPLVLQALLEASFETAARVQQREQRQFKRAYMTLKTKLFNRIQQTDYIPEGPFPVTLQKNEYATRTQNNFGGYWKNQEDPPLLCYFAIPPKMKKPGKP